MGLWQEVDDWDWIKQQAPHTCSIVETNPLPLCQGAPINHTFIRQISVPKLKFFNHHFTAVFVYISHRSFTFTSFIKFSFLSIGIYFKGPWARPVWGVWTLAPCVPRPLAHKTNRRGNSSLCSSTPQQGMISHLNCLNHSVWLYQGTCLIRIG